MNRSRYFGWIDKWS